MIVKNETANLERCLRAVAGHISCWVIGDTGSTDGTQDLIEHFFAARGIPGELHSFPFENFAQARNEALDRARASRLAFDYLLLTDADMELTVQDPDFPSKLNAAAYKVLQNSGVSYWNNRLLRRDAPAGYKGVTHEFLDVRAGETKNLVGIRFIDHATGSNRVDKYDRDIKLLTGAIAAEQDPGMIARYSFYLANTLRDSGKKQAALAAYAERASLGGWPQEVFISLLNVAKIKEELQYPAAEVISAYEAATTACPTRAEALHAASRYCRSQSLYEQGYEFAARGLAIAYPDDALFVEDWAYEYGLLDELAIAAYWTERYEESQAACDRLLSEGKLPDNQRDRVLQNKNFAIGKQQEIAALASPDHGEFLRLLGQARALEAQLGPDDEIIAAYEQATAASAARAEALHDAARFCRNKARYEQGYAFAARGLAITPPGDAPAAERWIYEYGLLDELAVTAYWTARYDECVAACDRLLSEDKLPVDQRARVLANKNFARGRREEIAAALACPPYLELLRAARDAEQQARPVDEVIAAYQAAAAAAPDHAEALHDAARYCRNKGLYDRGYEFALQGLAIDRPDDVPAGEGWIYEYGLLQELSITGNYARDPVQKARGFAACNWLSLNRGVAAPARHLATSNLYFYLQPAPAMMPSFAARQVQFAAPDGYHAMNPSIARRGDRLVLIQRTVNYAIDHVRSDGDHLQYEVADGVFRTRNFLLYLSDDLGSQSCLEILPPVAMPEPLFPRNLGFQDLRPFVWHAELWCSGFVAELTPEGRYEQVLARIDEETPKICRLSDWRVLRPDGSQRHEKNWMPRLAGDSLDFIYSCDPCRLVDEQARTLGESTPPILADGFRGGSQAVAFDDGWLALVHEVRVRDGRRQYRHRFIWLDQTSRLRRVSRPFFFQKHGVEFAAGLAWHPDGKRLLISYGIDDCESWIATVDVTDIKRNLDDAERLPSGRAADESFDHTAAVSAMTATPTHKRSEETHAPTAQPAAIHFIVGVPRSGTTLFRAMLGAHPKICAPSETPWLTGAYGGGPSLRELMQNLAAADNGPIKNIKNVSLPDITRAAENFLSQLFATKMRAEEKDILVLKTPDDIWFVDDLIKFFPASKIIHVRRDVRDVALSTIASGWPVLNHFGENSFSNAVNRWIACERKITEIAKTNPNIASFRFEDLVTRPRIELERAASFLDLPFDAAMLDYAQHLIDAPTWEAGSRDIKRHKAVEATRAWAYKTKTPTDEQRQVIDLHSREIALLGYPQGWQADAGIASIPRVFHFITGLDENFGGKPFSFIHYMAVRSALAANPGFRAKVYYHFEPSGYYWDAIKADIESVRVELPAEVFGNPVEHFAHKADVLRMRILLEQGGIYLDLDTICQRPFAPLLDGRVVMGREEQVLADGSRQTVGLCNATIIAPPDAEFIRLWYEAYRDFKGGPSGDSWNKFSVQIPMQLANEYAEMLRIEPASSFFWPSWDSAGIDAMFAADREFPEAYSFHLWESQSWPMAKNLDAETIMKVDTTYNKIARKFIGTDALLTGNDGEANMVNEDMVRAAYRVILGREPESQTAINWHLRNAENPEIMLRNFIDSAEFKLKNARGGPDMQEKMLDLLSKFTPSGVTGYAKIRVGNQTGDGGYVMLDDFTDIAGALSAGIGNDVTWDLDIAGHGIDVYQFDHTVSGPPVAHERFKFFPRMISSIEADGSESIKTMIEKIPDREGRLIMKIDIEGAEWDALDAAELSDLRRISQIVGEFHGFSNATDSDWRERAMRVITKLNEVFQIVHLHANNWQPLEVIANVPFPGVIELAFANRSMYTFEATTEIFPTELDRPNRADLPDIFLGSLAFKREPGSEAH
jgi:hypothetical protein